MEAAKTLEEQIRVEWQKHPATQNLLKWLCAVVDDTMKAWANEEFVGESLEQGALQTAKALGGISQVKDTINFINGETNGE